MTSKRNPARQKMQAEINAIPAVPRKRNWRPRFDMTSTWVALAIAFAALLYNLLIWE
ncbi:hypothetical protein [Allosphingosinicella vermicomposti]|uniref:hypothetical protein n=1 Tax=Allosphingosinicella vermicomposti TaxID=614671 RepID=UPI00131A5025|nr:hypothetical protein [Allosphingosinicella vermicomposti]